MVSSELQHHSIEVHSLISIPITTRRYLSSCLKHSQISAKAFNLSLVTCTMEHWAEAVEPSDPIPLDLSTDYFEGALSNIEEAGSSRVEQAQDSPSQEHDLDDLIRLHRGLEAAKKKPDPSKWIAMIDFARIIAFALLLVACCALTFEVWRLHREKEETSRLQKGWSAMGSSTWTRMNRSFSLESHRLREGVNKLWMRK